MGWKHGLVALCGAIVFFLCLDEASGSRGDRDPTFLRCVEGCKLTGCAGSNACKTVCNRSEEDAPLFLRLLRWDCDADCKYHCMRITNDERVQEWGRQYTWKYYGKWPFLRFMGMQEPASVLFSILHFGLQTFLLSKYWKLVQFAKRQDPKSRYPYSWLWILEGVISLNTWMWSVVFHSRDTMLTEKLDYLSAILVIYFGLYRTLIRVFEMKSVRAAAAVGLAVSCLYIIHIYYLLRVHFDYGLNIVICTINGILQLSLLLGWAFYTGHNQRNTLLAATLLLYVATLLEIFDFPPLFEVFDAHSLWHLLSLPAPYGWYRFYCGDTRSHLLQGKTE